MPELSTVRMQLRLVTEADAGLLCELDSDPEVLRYLNGGIPTALETITREILPRFLSYPRHAPWAGVWLAFEREAGRLVGWFSIRPAPDGGAELGYRLCRASWGRGLATEGAHILLSHAFGSNALPRVCATTYEDNLRSRRVLEKLGMRVVRRFRPTPDQAATFEPDAGEPWPGDDLEYAIDAETWRTTVSHP